MKKLSIHLKGRYGSKVARYFKKLYEKDRDVPPFSVGGAKKKRKEWDVIDYQAIGGNCLEFDSRNFTFQKETNSDQI